MSECTLIIKWNHNKVNRVRDYFGFKSKIADAELVIRTHGLAKATTKEIAKTAGCSEGSLYNHFKSKDDLYLHILRGQLKMLCRRSCP